MGVEIPEKPDYGHEDADIINAKNEILGEFYNLDHPRTKRMSEKITQDECSRALGAECNDYDYRPVQGRTRQDSSRVIQNYVGHSEPNVSALWVLAAVRIGQQVQFCDTFPICKP